MKQLLTLSRAARLVGVKRGALQKKIRDGELPTFEGKVSADDLLRLYPQAHLEDNKELERVTHIKTHAFARRVRDYVLPDAEVLAARLTELGTELAEAKAKLDRYSTFVSRLKDKCVEIDNISGEELQSAIGLLSGWLHEQFDIGLLKSVHAEPLLVKDRLLRVMAANVHILPSGHEFFVEGTDSVLEAALRAGLALEYGCSNGNCGQCKARLISGEIKKTRNHDFVISEAEKGMGHMLMCSNTAVTDLVIEAHEAGGVQDIPLQQISARVKGLERVNDDMMVINLQTPRKNRLRFLSGQSVTLSAGNGLKADYAVASCPCDDRNLEFHICGVKGNDFTDYVFNKLTKTDVVAIEGPNGDFVLQEESPNPIIFLAHDTGFAPIKSLLEHAMALDVAESMHLYWVVSVRGNHYLHNLCRAYADALDNFHYTPLVAADASAALERVVDDHPDLNEFDVYVSGPRRFASVSEKILIDRGLPDNQLIIGTIS